MRTQTPTYQGYIDRANTIFDNLKAQQPLIECQMAEWNYYCNVTLGDQGQPHLRMKWDDRGNYRHGYQSDVPGFVSETIKVYALLQAGLRPEQIEVVHDQERQTKHGIDLIYEGHTNQVKTVCFRGTRLFIDPTWVRGVATLITLVDIDNHLLYDVPRTSLVTHVNKTINMDQLDAIGSKLVLTRQY